MLYRIAALATIALVAAFALAPAAAEEPDCHPLGKGMSSIDFEGNVTVTCWPLVIVGGLASDH